MTIEDVLIAISIGAIVGLIGGGIILNRYLKSLEMFDEDD